MAPFLRDASRGEGPGFARHRAEYGPAGKGKHDLARPAFGWNPHPRARAYRSGFSATSGVQPAGKVGFYELLNALAAGEAQPDRPSFPLHAHHDIEERAAEPFSGREFQHPLNRRSIRRKLELEAIRQLAAASVGGG